jgi:hypothetical protein
VITISKDERDAIYDLVVSRLGDIGAVSTAIEAEHYETASRLALEFSDLLRFILDDLGWGKGPKAHGIALSTDPDALRRIFTALHDHVIGQRRAEEPEWEDARIQEEKVGLVTEASRAVLAALTAGAAREP